MAEKLTGNKMAVTSNSQFTNQPGKGEVAREDGGENQTKVGQDNVPKKKSTFKITSITKGQTQRGGSGDLAGDVDGDSLDDLDESHTDDITSDMLDSSKASDLDQGDAVLTPDEVVNREKPADPQSRFRVVKIETKEPFRRGRWLCYDFLDTPTTGTTNATAEKAEAKNPSVNHADDTHTATSNTIPNAQYIHTHHSMDDGKSQHGSAGNAHYQIPDGNTGSSNAYSQHTQSESFKPIHPAPPPSQQQVPPAHQSQRQSDATVPSHAHSPSPYTVQQQGVPQQQNRTQGGVQMQTVAPIHSGGQHIPAAHPLVSQNLPQTNIVPNAQNTSHLQANANLPQSIPVHPHPVQGAYDQAQGSRLMQPTQLGATMPVGGAHISRDPNQPAMTQNYPLTPSGYPMPKTGGVPMDNMSYSQAVMGQQGTNMQPVYTTQTNQPLPYGKPAGSGGGQSGMTTDMHHVDNVQMMKGDASVQVPAGMMNVDMNNKDVVRPDSLHLNEAVQNGKDGNIPNKVQGDVPLLTPLAAAVGGMASPAREVDSANRPVEATESGSGSSTVAIDNKIEQAMDLVKSHLMFAVREEVEVLKEQIKELVERISQLEWENSILRTHASPDVLALLQQPRTQPSTSSS